MTNYMWENLSIPYGGYNGKIDSIILDVMERSFTDRFYNTDIAEDLKISPEFVELIQYLLCNTGLWDYGSSPRGCFPVEGAKEFYLKCCDAFKENYNE